MLFIHGNHIPGVISAIVASDHQMEKFNLGRYFVASDDPLFIGLIVSPSEKIWPRLKNADSVVLEIGISSFAFRIPYKIEVGRNTIFFVSPAENESQKILESLK